MDEQGDEQLDFGDDEEQLQEQTWEEDGDGEGAEHEDIAQEEKQEEDDELARLGECLVHAGSC